LQNTEIGYSCKRIQGSGIRYTDRHSTFPLNLDFPHQGPLPLRIDLTTGLDAQSKLIQVTNIGLLHTGLALDMNHHPSKVASRKAIVCPVELFYLTRMTNE